MVSAGSSQPGFVHLHLHTHFSLLDGAIRIDKLIERVKALGMSAVAITDHGNMFGVIDFYKAATAAGIKPIIGAELYIAPGDRRERDAKGIRNASHHVVLLAMNRTGYQNLVHLSSIAYREGFYYRPRIDKEILREFNEGLICTSACLSGEIPRALLKNKEARARELAEQYLDIFGDDRFFIEVQDHGMEEQRAVGPKLEDLAKRFGVGVVATNDAHYLDSGDVEAHDVLCCISTGKLVSDENRIRFPNGEFYLKTPKQMAELFADSPESLSNTLRVADMCDVEFDFSVRHAPVYKVDADTTPEKELHRLVYEGAAEKYHEITDELRERIDYELEVISSKGFASYFLIVWDFVRFARQNNIPVGARGSGCSSVVAYCLNISAPDPMEYGLFFERFMDPDRDEMPDIDADICQNGRAKVIDYVRSKYGHVAQIITFGTLKAKAAVKDVARVMGLGFEEASKLTSLIPADLKMTIDKALEQEPELRRQYEQDQTIRKIIDISKKLEGLNRHAGVHAAGVVVADKPLENFLPLYKASGDDAMVTQFDGNTVETVGLLKMDFLGLRTLTTLQRARELVKTHKGIDVDLDKLDLEDPRVFELFSAGRTKGVFQFESGGMRDVIMRMRPNRILDLIAANALYRPGPMKYIDDYVARKHGTKWTTPHPVMSEVLEETYGIMVYQEQVSRLVNRLGGLELKRAFRLAKLISKKKTSRIEAERTPFLAGCEQNGLDHRTAQKVFDDILEFGGYAFNKAHSTGYALVAFQTAYMKAYHPVEFMAALLTFEMGTTAKVQEYIEECRAMGIEVAPPDVNTSGNDFTPDYSDPNRKVIRFGLGAIKGVGAKAVEAIVSVRHEGGAFSSLFDFCGRVDLTAVNRIVVEALVSCGAFDRTGAMRKALTQVVDAAIQDGQASQRDKRDGQSNFFDQMLAGPDDEASAKQLSDDEWNEAELLAREKAVLGFYVTRHPLASCSDLIEACATVSTSDLRSFSDKTKVTIGGIITGLRQVVARNSRRAGGKMGILTIEDLAGKVDVIIPPETFEEHRAVLKPDTIVFVRGEISRRREEPSIRGTAIIPADRACAELSTCLLLRFDDEIDNEETLKSVLAVCKAHAGPRPLYLEVKTDADRVAVIRCASSMSVSCEEACLSALARILGPKRVVCTGPARRPIPWAFAPESSVPESPPVR